MSFGNLSSRIGRNGASNRSGAYDGRMMRTMRSVGVIKTSTASAEQSFWPYGTSAHRVATFSTASAIELRPDCRRGVVKRPPAFPRAALVIRRLAIPLRPGELAPEGGNLGLASRAL